MTHGCRFEVLLLTVVLLVAPSRASAAGIAGTKHNLSVTGPGPVKSTTEEQICVFCHTPHNARRDVPYLWNREDSAANYATYDSSTMLAAPGQPSGASKLCLSCHDGTIALGALWNRSGEVPFEGGVRFIPAGPSRLGTDLADDHPVSVSYVAGSQGLHSSESNSSGRKIFAIAEPDFQAAKLHPPSTLPEEIDIDPSGRIQCTSCHDPHDDSLGDFLVLSTEFSELCGACHDPEAWDMSSHSLSSATWNGASPDPWPRTDFDTVAENACASCHQPHAAPAPERLLSHILEEETCLVCHNGNVAGSNIESELTKAVTHPVRDYLGVHDPVESSPSSIQPHVECMDCHQPHQVNDSTAVAPDVPGSMGRVSGVSGSGLPVTEVSFAYEICFKCHADHNVLTFTDITRQISEINTRMEFDLSNPSYHPVEGIGANPNMRGLLPPYTVNSVIYCTDCHSNDEGPGNNGQGPGGPHGSRYPYLLERNYETNDNTSESTAAYALCYKCHDRDALRDKDLTGFEEHKKHIEGEDAPCSACHDPHGVSSTQGTAANNSHLINFDLNIVQPSSSTGLLFFEDLGISTGQCYLTCHGQDHNPEEYGQ